MLYKTGGGMVDEGILHLHLSSSFLPNAGRRVCAYSPYGVVHDNGAAMIAFNAELRDSATSNYLLGKGRRMYSPALMRFLSADRLSPFSRGGINAYAYCHGNPVNRVDPTGQYSVPKVIANTVWLGKRVKASMSNLKGLKRLDDRNKWVKKVGVVMVAAGVPGANWVNAASFAVKMGSATVDIGFFFGRKAVDYFVMHKVRPMIAGILPPNGLSHVNSAPPVSQVTQVREGHSSRRHSSAF
ncbi:RHS repeat-associated core domain-containing protein [Pseudomonas sp. LB-090624]|nr:RHS repeat-associated core domain-containing protein [Pseudomonas sp. LB-090624]PYB75974.1 RHS repeat-associated core domain-containing protein [Pseudomonas sp. LB-090624]